MQVSIHALVLWLSSWRWQAGLPQSFRPIKGRLASQKTSKAYIPRRVAWDEIPDNVQYETAQRKQQQSERDRATRPVVWEEARETKKHNEKLQYAEFKHPVVQAPRTYQQHLEEEPTPRGLAGVSFALGAFACCGVKRVVCQVGTFPWTSSVVTKHRARR